MKRILRISFNQAIFKTPFCTAIGQTLSMIEQYIVINIIFYRNFRINKKGEVVRNGKV